MTIQQADAIKFLELLLSECSTGCKSGDHEWRKCRRCLAIAEVEGHHKLARGFVQQAITALKDAGAAALSRQREQDDHGAAAVQAIEQFAAGWDESGLVGIREPYRWETVARACLDVLRSIAVRHIAIHGVQPLAVQPSAALSQPSRQLENDDGAGLIHQAIPDMAGTEPRPNEDDDDEQTRAFVAGFQAAEALRKVTGNEHRMSVETSTNRAATVRVQDQGTTGEDHQVGSATALTAERADGTRRSEAQESISHSDQSAALVPHGWQTCATCRHLRQETPMNKPPYGAICTHPMESHPMHWQETTETFGCIFHTPLSPDPPQEK